MRLRHTPSFCSRCFLFGLTPLTTLYISPVVATRPSGKTWNRVHCSLSLSGPILVFISVTFLHPGRSSPLGVSPLGVSPLGVSLLLGVSLVASSRRSHPDTPIIADSPIRRPRLRSKGPRFRSQSLRSLSSSLNPSSPGLWSSCSFSGIAIPSDYKTESRRH